MHDGKGLRAQLLKAGVFHSSQRMVRGHGRHQFVVADDAVLQVGNKFEFLGEADGCIDFLTVQGSHDGVRRHHGDLYAQLRIGFLERAQRRNQAHAHDVVGDGDPDLAYLSGGSVPAVLHGILVGFDYMDNVPVKIPAGLCELDGTIFSCKQFKAQLLLHFGDAEADGSLGNILLHCGFGKT